MCALFVSMSYVRASMHASVSATVRACERACVRACVRPKEWSDRS